MKCLQSTLFSILFCVTTASYAQQDYIKEIDEQVWKPFIDHFSSYNTEKFMQLHDTDMVRASLDRKSIFGYKNYYSSHRRSDSSHIAKQIKRTIEFKFLNRVANSTDAFEIGLYKSVVSYPGKPDHTFYGKFWVLLRKVNGVWKIKLDADSSSEATKETYDAAK
jgi:hypothetical protein